MTCQTCQDRLIDQVSGGALPDAAEIAAHVADCAECRHALAGLQEAYHSMAFGIPPVSVSPAIKQQLMSRVDADLANLPFRLPVSTAAAATSPEHWISKSFKLFCASAVAAGMAVIVTHNVMIHRVRELQQINEQIGSALDFSQRQNVALQEDVTRHGADVKVLQAADLKLVNLAAQTTGPGGACRLFFGGDGGYLVVRDAPPPPAGRTYELWLIDGSSKKTAAGTFNVGPDGSARIPVKFDAAAAAGAAVVAVTDEPPGGVAQPTGSIRYAGKVQ